jgi:hypothetical protein
LFRFGVCDDLPRATEFRVSGMLGQDPKIAPVLHRTI